MVTNRANSANLDIHRGEGVELFDVLDANGEKTGQVKPRHLVHRDGDWHRAVMIWVVNPERGILLQRRAPNKDSHPNCWDISCGGHLSAGDDSITGAIRELAEELGLKVKPEDLHFLLASKRMTRPAPDFINNSFDDLYIYFTNLELNQFVMQKSEISALKYVSLDELKSMVREHNSDLAPHEPLYEKLFQYLDGLQNC